MIKSLEMLSLIFLIKSDFFDKLDKIHLIYFLKVVV